MRQQAEAVLVSTKFCVTDHDDTCILCAEALHAVCQVQQSWLDRRLRGARLAQCKLKTKANDPKISHMHCQRRVACTARPLGHCMDTVAAVLILARRDI